MAGGKVGAYEEERGRYVRSVRIIPALFEGLSRGLMDVGHL